MRTPASHVLGWLAAAAISAYACYLAVHHDTPIDRALPLIAVLVTVVAWASYPAVMLAIPLLIAAEIAIPDDTVRLLAFGLIWSAAALPPLSKAPASPAHSIALILLLRWIPLEDVLIARELFLIALAVLITLVLGRTPFAVAVAVIAVLITPAVPLRTLAVPLLVLFVATLARIFGMPRLRFTVPSLIALGFVTTFFAWSGIVARAFPYFLREARATRPRHIVNEALPLRRTIVLDVPYGAQSLIVSGANVPRLRRGALLGRIEPGGRIVRIGDAADWGYMRREQFYGARNPLPRDAAGKIRGYGYAAWVDGAGRILLPPNARTIRVTADASLPADAALQVESFE